MKIPKLVGLFVSITLLFITCDKDDVEVNELKDGPKLTFTKLTVNKKDVTKEELLQQIKEKEKEGFSIRRITVSDDAFAEVQGTAPNFSLKIKKPGTFTIKITLHKTGFKEVTIEATIVYVATEALTFDKLSTAKNTLSKDDILKQVKGNKDGFTIKSITVSDSDFAAVQGTAPNLSLKIKKAGDFTATIVLQKTNYKDVTLNASFSGVPETLTFDKLSTYKKNIPKADILKQVKGGSGYTIKSIVVNQSAFATVGSDLSLTILKEGDFTANITLQKAGYFDVVINNAAFKATSDALSFSIFKTDKKTLTKTDIFNQIQGNKTGYTLTKIAVTDNSYADVNPTTYSLTLKKDGTFAVTLTLQKAGVQKTLNGQIEYRPKPALTFAKLTTSKKTITQAEINTQIKGNKNSYTIKNIVVANSNFATVTGTAGNFSLALKRTGTFSATITLGRTNYSDVTLNASLEGRAENLSFNAFSITYGGTPTIANSVILAQVQGAGKANYTLKSISNISDDSVAEVQGSGSNSSIKLKKAGTFTAALVLERNGYFDVTIPAASFTIQKAASKTLGFNKLSIDYKKIISKAELKAKITGSDKADYTIQKIDNINPRDAAELTGAGLHIKKTGDFTAKLTLVHAFYGDATVTANITIQKGNAKNIRFDKLTLPYQATISKARLAQNLKGDKDGYTIKSISTISDSDVAELSGTNLKIKKAGNFTARLTLTHAFYKDTNVNASFTIQKLPKKTLGFTKFISTYKNLLTRKDILEKVTGQKDGYTLKAISGISDSDIAELTGAGLHIKKAGSFTATLTLEHSIYLDETLTGAAFEIKAYSFTKLVTAYKQTLTKADIEKQVQGMEAGYTLKSISAISNTDIAALTGGSAKALHLKKPGSFTAIITMEKASNKDIVIPKAEFEIQKLSAQKLGFNALSVSKEYLTQADILRQVTGAKAGYTLKAISGISDSDVAELSGTGLKIKKAGSFTATLTLEHNIYSDATLTGAAFTITKLTAPKLSFDKLTLPYQKVVSEATILQQVKGAKNGYTLKNISEISGTELTGAHIAELTGTPKAALHLKKAGSFSAKITLTHPLYADVEITGAQFEITLKIAFNQLTIAYKKLITSAEIEAQIQGLAVSGYSLKSISEISGISEITGSDIVELTGTPKTSLYIKKPGRFTATLTLGKASKADRNLTGATFIITKAPAKKLSFKKITTYKTLVTQKEILAALTGAPLENGYTLKISNIQDISGANLAELSGLSIKIKKQEGVFTADLLLQHPSYLDTTLTGARFEKEKAFVFDKSKKAIIGVTPKYKKIFKKATEVTFPDQIEGIHVEEIKGNTAKRINVFGLSGSPFAVVQTIHLPKNLKTIGENAFRWCGEITSIKIPESVTTIGDFAFEACRKLTFNLPNSLETIGRMAFSDCDALTSVTIPNSVKTIGRGTFNSCNFIRSVTIGNSLQTISVAAFLSCDNLASVTMGNSVKTIERTAFMGCHELSSIKFSESLETIGDSAFGQIKNLVARLTSVNLPSSVTTIGSGAFSNKFNLTHITLPASIQTIGKNAFSNCIRLTVSIKKRNPTAVTVGTTAFDNVRKIMVPNRSLYAYRNASIWKKWKNKMEPLPAKRLALKLTTYKNWLTPEDIIAQVTDLSKAPLEKGYTLKALTGLQAVSGGPGLAELSGLSIHIKKQEGAFTANLILQHPYYAEMAITGATFKKEKAFVFDKQNKAITGVTAKYKEIFKTATEVTFPDQIEGVSVKVIGTGNMFGGPNVFGNMGIGAGVNTPDNNTTIKTIHLPKNLETITHKAFYACQALTAITLPESVTTIGMDAFAYCASLTSINLPNSITSIGPMTAFAFCTSLESVTLPKGLQNIENSTFSGCTSLASVTLPQGLKNIGQIAFSNCTSLTSINLPQGLQKIGQKAFNRCSSLRTITLPLGGISLQREAFKDCTQLTVTVKEHNPTRTGLFSGVFSGVPKIKVPPTSLKAYRESSNWGTWKNKMDIIPVKKLALKLTTYKNLLTPKDIIAQVTELSGTPLEAGYTLKALSGLQEVSGGPGLAEISGLSIKIKKREGSFTADLVLAHPLYLDMTLTGATFKKEKAFVFDKSTGTISGVTAKYKTYFKTATEATFPDQIEGVDVTVLKGIGAFNSVFDDNNNTTIKTIHLPRNLKTIGVNTFSKCRALTTITIPSSVTEIGIESFGACSYLTSVTIMGKSLLTINTSAFSGCGRLTSINIPNSLANFGSMAFLNCKRLTSITLPQSIRIIASLAFEGCTKLSVTLKQPDPTQITLHDNGQTGSDQKYPFDDVKQIIVPDGQMSTYIKTAPWSGWISKFW